jgi:RHS repeat-associated protein
VLRYFYADSATSSAHSSWAGYTYALTNADGTVTHWQGTTRALDGTLTSFKLGGGASTTARAYNGLGQLSTLTTGTSSTSDLQNASYSFDRLGNLKQRGDGAVLGGAPLLSNEYFSYDKLNRLTHKGSAANPSLASEELAAYDAIGNFTTKAGVTGTYNYDASTNRLASIAVVGGTTARSFAYDGNGNLSTDSGDSKGARSLSYTPFDQPKTITQVNETVTYVYDAYGQRIKESSTTSGSTYYLPGAEYHLPTGSTGVASGTSQLQEHKTYLASPDGIIGTHTKRSSATGGALPSGYPATTLRYWHKDHLGSVVLITRTDGSVAQRFRYDAWGKRSRDSASAQSNNADATDEARGYTEHEHLDEVGLTHMNGRLHDPVLGRFISADPMVADGYDSQSLNRYSYVYNNPLAYSDPSGYIAQAASAAGMGYYGGNGGGSRGGRGSNGSNGSNTILPYSSLSIMSVVGSGYYGNYNDQSITGGDIERAIYHVFAARGSLGVGQIYNSQVLTIQAGNGVVEMSKSGGPGTELDAKQWEAFQCENDPNQCKTGRPTLDRFPNPTGGPDGFLVGWTSLAGGGAGGGGGSAFLGVGGNSRRDLEIGGLFYSDHDDFIARRPLSDTYEMHIDVMSGMYGGLRQAARIRSQKGSPSAAKQPKEPQTLFHYTNEAGMKGIVESKVLFPSLKSLNPRDVRYGNGQYLSDIKPGTLTDSQLSRNFLGQPFQGKRFSNFVEINVSGLNVVRGRDGVYVIPNEGTLNLSGRIVRSGVNSP